MLIQNKNTNQKGFTLIELLVSSAIFLITVTVGLSSLLLMHRASKITQYKKEQFDTLNAIMEDMVRNIRVGSDINCDSSANYNESNVDEAQDCVNTTDDQPASQYIVFEGTEGIKYTTTNTGSEDDQIGYYIASEKIYKTTGVDAGGLTNSQLLTPDPIKIIEAKSGFSVIHAEDSDPLQPLVTIRLAGTVTYQGSSTPFIIQTATVQRTAKD
jgi:prepilin-type N-terminal cleavage/methylation domain-containing protein